MEKLTEIQLSEIKTAFQTFGRDKDGKINLRELGVAMRTMGHNHTDNELREMISKLDSDNDNAISFEEFVHLLSNKMNDSETEDKTLEGFRVCNKKEQGLIKVVELKRILLTLGELISEEECDALIEIFKAEDGLIDYDSLVKAIFNSIV